MGAFIPRNDAETVKTLLFAVVLVGVCGIALFKHLVQAIGLARICKKLGERRGEVWVPGFQPLAVFGAGDTVATRRNVYSRSLSGFGKFALLFGPIMLVLFAIAAIILIFPMSFEPDQWLLWLLDLLLYAVAVAVSFFLFLLGLSYYEILAVPALFKMVMQLITLEYLPSPTIWMILLIVLAVVGVGYVIVSLVQCISYYRIYRAFAPVWVCLLLAAARFFLPGLSCLTPLIISFFPIHLPKEE